MKADRISVRLEVTDDFVLNGKNVPLDTVEVWCAHAKKLAVEMSAVCELHVTMSDGDTIVIRTYDAMGRETQREDLG